MQRDDALEHVHEAHGGAGQDRLCCGEGGPGEDQLGLLSVLICS